VFDSGDALGGLRTALAARIGIKHCHPTCTGRAALTILLRAMRRLAPLERDEVIVPSYTCFSVPASVVRAGLKPRVVDIDPESLDYDEARLERADHRRVLAIVATNLYGLPNDMPHLSAFARSRGVFLVDDAAQALGARVAGRPSGSWGDAGLISFDKGKNVSALEGGAILTDSADLNDAVCAEMLGRSKRSLWGTAGALVKISIYAALLRPRLYWLPQAIPQLGLGRTVYSTSFDLQACAPLVAALARIMLGRLDEFTARRRENAARLATSLRGRSGIVLPHAAATAEPCYLRFPLLAPDAASRDRIVRTLVAAGIGATGSYPLAVADIPGLRGRLADRPEIPGGREVARRIVTLPTHPFVAPRDLEAMERIIVDAARPPNALAARAFIH
jgi:dTDP-4-amino-4,6-dideoxygalactose transaminase